MLPVYIYASFKYCSISEASCFTIINFHTRVCSREADDPYEGFFSDQGSKVAMQALSDQKFFPKLLKASYLGWPWRGSEPYWFLRPKY